MTTTCGDVAPNVKPKKKKPALPVMLRTTLHAGSEEDPKAKIQAIVDEVAESILEGGPGSGPQPGGSDRMRELARISKHRTDQRNQDKQKQGEKKRKGERIRFFVKQQFEDKVVKLFLEGGPGSGRYPEGSGEHPDSEKDGGAGKGKPYENANDMSLAIYKELKTHMTGGASEFRLVDTAKDTAKVLKGAKVPKDLVDAVKKVAELRWTPEDHAKFIKKYGGEERDGNKPIVQMIYKMHGKLVMNGEKEFTKKDW